MDFIKLTQDEKEEVLNNLDQKEKVSIKIAESILQKIAGIYINKAGYHPEMADFYRNVAGSLRDLIEVENQNV